ncbi:numb-associated kinase isoform a [Anaeramoeba flamelloides]|uniref:non-specific serine/threonine protein kinase n=1 Tax=Anaeramoeba flamelloides TaxID=1746091 RepID=A0AAV8A5E0_9EUKA|nr:numb-associated kinase isoform a [Anaeramoeba flamelloides]
MNFLKSLGQKLNTPIVTTENPSIGRVLTIDKKKIKINSLIAEGGYGYVFKATDLSTNQIYAVKKLIYSSKSGLEKIISEYRFQRLVSKKKNVVSVYGYSKVHEDSNNYIYILMEYCPNSLIDRMNVLLTENSRFDEKQALKIFHSICCGVYHMHSLSTPLVHRDLKVENVLISQKGTIKLCDFGSATQRVYTLESRQERYEAENDIEKNTTLAYRSPEMIDLFLRKRIDVKSDIWALGCIWFKILFFEDVFNEGSTLQILNKAYKIPKKSGYSQEAIALIEWLLESDPDTRPDIYDVIERVSKMRGVKPLPRIIPKNKPKQPKINEEEKKIEKKNKKKNKKTPTFKKLNQNNQTQNAFDTLDWYDNPEEKEVKHEQPNTADEKISNIPSSGNEEQKENEENEEEENSTQPNHVFFDPFGINSNNNNNNNSAEKNDLIEITETQGNSQGNLIDNFGFNLIDNQNGNGNGNGNGKQPKEFEQIQFGTFIDSNENKNTPIIQNQGDKIFFEEFEKKEKEKENQSLLNDSFGNINENQNESFGQFNSFENNFQEDGFDNNNDNNNNNKTNLSDPFENEQFFTNTENENENNFINNDETNNNEFKFGSFKHSNIDDQNESFGQFNSFENNFQEDGFDNNNGNNNNNETNLSDPFKNDLFLDKNNGNNNNNGNTTRTNNENNNQKMNNNDQTNQNDPFGFNDNIKNTETNNDIFDYDSNKMPEEDDIFDPFAQETKENSNENEDEQNFEIINKQKENNNTISNVEEDLLGLSITEQNDTFDPLEKGFNDKTITVATTTTVNNNNTNENDLFNNDFIPLDNQSNNNLENQNDPFNNDTFNQNEKGEINNLDNFNDFNNNDNNEKTILDSNNLLILNNNENNESFDPLDILDNQNENNNSKNQIKEQNNSMQNSGLIIDLGMSDGNNEQTVNDDPFQNDQFHYENTSGPNTNLNSFDNFSNYNQDNSNDFFFDNIEGNENENQKEKNIPIEKTNTNENEIQVKEIEKEKKKENKNEDEEKGVEKLDEKKIKNEKEIKKEKGKEKENGLENGFVYDDPKEGIQISKLNTKENKNKGNDKDKSSVNNNEGKRDNKQQTKQPKKKKPVIMIRSIDITENQKKIIKNLSIKYRKQVLHPTTQAIPLKTVKFQSNTNTKKSNIFNFNFQSAMATFSNDLDSSITKYTSSSLKIPKNKYSRRIIITTWEEQKHRIKDTIKSVFLSALKRPIDKDELVGLKFINLVMNLLQDGATHVLSEINCQNPILSKLYKNWEKQTNNETIHRKILLYYIEIVQSKIKFHLQYPEFEGSFSIDTYLADLKENGIIEPYYGNGPISAETIETLIKYQNLLIGYLQLTVDQRYQNLINNNLDECQCGCLLVILNESMAVYKTICFIFSRLYCTALIQNLRKDSLFRIFLEQLEIQKEFFDRVLAINIVKNLYGPSKLPKKRPVFKQTQRTWNRYKLPPSNNEDSFMRLLKIRSKNEKIDFEKEIQNSPFAKRKVTQNNNNNNNNKNKTGNNNLNSIKDKVQKTINKTKMNINKQFNKKENNNKNIKPKKSNNSNRVTKERKIIQNRNKEKGNNLNKKKIIQKTNNNNNNNNNNKNRKNNINNNNVKNNTKPKTKKNVKKKTPKKNIKKNNDDPFAVLDWN